MTTKVLLIGGAGPAGAAIAHELEEDEATT